MNWNPFREDLLVVFAVWNGQLPMSLFHYRCNISMEQFTSCHCQFNSVTSFKRSINCLDISAHNRQWTTSTVNCTITHLLFSVFYLFLLSAPIQWFYFFKPFSIRWHLFFLAKFSYFVAYQLSSCVTAANKWNEMQLNWCRVIERMCAMRCFLSDILERKSVKGQRINLGVLRTWKERCYGLGVCQTSEALCKQSRLYVCWAISAKYACVEAVGPTLS
jgi:hypothetical protein